MPTSANASGVSHIIVEGITWHVIDEEIVGQVQGATFGASTRFQLAGPR